MTAPARITAQAETTLGRPCALRESRGGAGKLTIGHGSEGGGHGFVYKTDGSESMSTLMNVKSVAIVSVKGDSLTIARVDNYPDGRVRENRQVWSMDAEGRLVIESKDGLKGARPTARKTVYQKRPRH